ncbi:hypothetical protein KKA33_00090 [Patescibacteria group bacterium]|nr:hypothetical protein [Patescibacteria group bacterium]
MDEKGKHLQRGRRDYLFKLMTSAYAEQELDVSTYQFNRVFIVFGYTGSGKDAVIDGFLQQNRKYPFSRFVRTLTRPKRPGENEVFSGYFVERELFDHLKDRGRFFYHYEKYDGDEFGYDSVHLIFLISKGNVIMIGGGEQNLPGLMRGIKSVFDNIPVTTVFINRPKEDILAGIRKRGGDPAQIEKRVQFIENEWKDRPLAHFDYFIWAEKLQEGVDTFRRMVEEKSELPKAV